MIYIRRNNDVLEKYEVNFSEEALIELRNRIIKHCSEVSKVKTECKLNEVPTYDYYRHNNNDRVRYHFEDVKYEKSGNTASEWDHYDEYQVDLYNCEYTMYKVPYIYEFIENVICGKEEAITILFNQDINGIKHFPTVEEKVKALESKLHSFESDYISKRKAKLDELNLKYKRFNETGESFSEKFEEMQSMISEFTSELSSMDDKVSEEKDKIDRELKSLQKIRDLNKNQEPITNYFYELVGLVEFKLVDTLSISDIDRINEFFNSNVIEKEKKLVLR